MPSDVQRRDSRKTANFHDHAARDLYVRHFGAIGIAAVAAGASQRATSRATPAARDIPAILRHGPEAD
jgi:hypothetical protein